VRKKKTLQRELELGAKSKRIARVGDLSLNYLELLGWKKDKEGDI